jgi:hypothetical protein
VVPVDSCEDPPEVGVWMAHRLLQVFLAEALDVLEPLVQGSIQLHSLDLLCGHNLSLHGISFVTEQATHYKYHYFSRDLSSIAYFSARQDFLRKKQSFYYCFE